ncbi:MAG: helix-turn-helix domain-containing protein [Bacilli bacterium]
MNELLNKEELAKRLKVSKQTIYRRSKNGLPFIKISEHCVRYDIEKINDWLNFKVKEGKNNGK